MNHFIRVCLLLCPLFCSRLAGAEDVSSPSAVPKSVSRPFVTLALGNPRSVSVDDTGNLYVGDVDSGKVHKLTPSGEVITLGGATASTIKDPIGLAVERNGVVIVADADANAVYRLSPDGAVTALPAQAGEASFSAPTSVATAATGDVFVTNNGSNTILKITPDGIASLFAGKAGASGSGDGTANEARFNTPRGIAVDGKGNLYVADEGNSNIRKITPAHVVSTLAGAAGESGSADGAGANARFASPRGLAADARGAVYVADTDNHTIRKINASGTVWTLAGKAGEAGKADGNGSAARFSEPRGIAVDSAGNVFVADTGNGAIRQITPDGIVTTIAAAMRPAQATTTAQPAGAEAPTPGSSAGSPAAPFVPTPAPIVLPRSGTAERIDYSHAQTLEGWNGDSTYWTVKDGAFVARGEKVPSTFLLTQKNYDDFRLTLSSQMVESENHAGVALWGEQTVASNGKNKWAYKGPLVIFPGLGLWDYRTNKGITVDPVGKATAKKIAGQHDWIKVEILAQGNRIRVAYNGQQVLDWREPDPSSLKAGPIGLQLHGYTKPQEVVYKDVVIESFPKEDRLITVKE